MGKDRSGRYHPPKGKPSDTSKEGLGLRPTMKPEDLEKDQEMTEKYTEGADKLGSNVRLLNPNRNTRKGKDQYKAPEEGSSRTYKEEMFTEDRSDTAPKEYYGVLTVELLKRLADFRSDYCITCILPTHRAGMEVNEQVDNILFKNVLQHLYKELDERKVNKLLIEQILEPGFELLRDDPFWRNLTNGLALFIAKDFFRYVKLPDTPEKKVIINNSFYLLDLFPLLNTNVTDLFYLLLIRRDKVTVYKSDSHGMREVPVAGMPANIAAVMDFGVKEQQSGNTSGETTEAPELITPGRPDKLVVDQYVRIIDSAFQQWVGDNDHWPAVLAGQPELLQEFRRVTSYDNLMDADFIVDDEYADNRKLYEEAMKSIREVAGQRLRERLDTYHNAVNLTTSVPADAISAAYTGKIHTLFVLKDEHIWGRFDKARYQPVMHATREEGDDCLLDKAAAQTILHGGDVYILNPDEMPERTVVAALLRYA